MKFKLDEPDEKPPRTRKLAAAKPHWTHGKLLFRSALAEFIRRQRSGSKRREYNQAIKLVIRQEAGDSVMSNIGDGAMSRQII
ncbi:MAG: hypothetical protein ACLQPD_06625 [Desulfomonilaceae bacterium]